eukprot:TRINITY_DN21851_c0_g2_i1.p1 TRINITY_DN21851_c0_g2~~TRINITY_DN21851_c0_g2_i1.p1  ORF type:complete len:810 (+),score=83.49 TRINITY_DN21851_c0_g2_i1:83-2431(+)
MEAGAEAGDVSPTVPLEAFDADSHSDPGEAEGIASAKGVGSLCTTGAGVTARVDVFDDRDGVRYVAADTEGIDQHVDEEVFVAQDEDSAAQVQRRLYLFQSELMQRSIRRIWDVLPKEMPGHLSMNGYVQLNLRLQRCLTRDFVLARAVDSAIGDWNEDMNDGQASMNYEDFAMFLFELCSLWCVPSVSLRAYLLFVNTVFVAVTDARGAHTVGLKDLEDIEVLPESFFELLSVQSCESATDEGLEGDTQAMNAWWMRNLSSDSEEATIHQVQRQIFQLTHDARAVILFQARGEGGRSEAAMGRVRISSHRLDGVGRIEPHALMKVSPGSAGKGENAAARGYVHAELCARPWCPPAHNKPPCPSKPIRASSVSGTADSSVPARGSSRARSSTRQSRSGLPAVLDRLGASRLDGAAPPAALANCASLAYPAPVVGARPVGAKCDVARYADAVPVGRAYDVVEARRPRGLAVAGAGRSTLAAAGAAAASAAGGGASSGASPPQPSPSNVDVCVAESAEVVQSSPMAVVTSEPMETSAVEEHGGIPWEAVAADIRTHLESGENSGGGFHLDGAAISPAYLLPTRLEDVYKAQLEKSLKVKPSSVVYAADKRAALGPKLVQEPFTRSLRKLPQHLRPESDGPERGPLQHPSEPVWFEMQHRLQLILKRQGRRAERRRKRWVRAKLMRGRGKKVDMRNDGMELREYLDVKAAEHSKGVLAQPGEIAGEFLGKVHERYLLNRDRLEAKPFRYRGTGGAVVDVYGVGKIPPRPAPVVRPVYVPPPAALV